MCKDLVSLHSVERLFHTLAPLYEKLFSPTVDFLNGSLKSVVVFPTLINFLKNTNPENLSSSFSFSSL